MKKTAIALMTIGSFVCGSAALATMDIQKEYKAKDATAKCATCHKDAMPKKDKKETQELNDFGKTVKAAQGADKKIDWAKVSAPKKG